MKKVGIMTWFRYINYGTALQATALYKIVKQLGYQPFMIDYTPKGKTVEQKNVTAKYVAEKCIKKVRNHNMESVAADVEKRFHYYIHETFAISEPCKTYPELEELSEKCNAVICGSDQIWSPLCFDPNYFLPFVDSKKKIAYAPSIGSSVISNKFTADKMTTLISEFNFLSVREQKGADIIKQLTGLKAKVVVDPTLLIDVEEWKASACTTSVETQMPEHYILGYFLGDNERYYSYMKRMSEELKLPAYIIPINTKQTKKTKPVPFTVGPAEFVSLIMNASFVCTDSFHGIAFSCNFNTPFVAFERFKNGSTQEQNSRIHNLLDSLNLQWRLREPGDMKHDVALLNANFEVANEHLKKLRAQSKEYLQDTLKKATSGGTCAPKKAIPYQITSLCCGCGTCATVCPKSAITITKNDDGFEHYKIDNNLCTQCGLCKTVCPFVHITAQPIQDAKLLYSAKSKENSILKKSSSGGIAYVLTESLGHTGYNVCGVQYNAQKKQAEHIIAKPQDSLQWHKFQGSKYIQSVSAQAIKEIVSLPEEKNLFFGTPCQVAGLDKVLRKKHCRENFLLVDLICHGVPSQLVWNKYLEQTASAYHLGEHPNVQFRDKVNGDWRRRRLLLTDSTGTHSYMKSEKRDDFYALFRRGYCYMESCFECPYREKSAADIRIGDYWGSRFESDKTGVSMVIANTKAGLLAINELNEEEKIELHPQELAEFWTVQYPQNASRPVFREELIERLKNPNISLHDLRTHYCKMADCQEAFEDFKQRVKKILHKG